MPSRKHDSAATIAGKHGHSLISTEKFRQMFQTLIAARLFSEHLRSSEKGTPAIHREAGPAGLILDLRPDDTVLLPSPGHFAHRVKGSSLKSLLTKAPAALAETPGRRLTEAVAIALNNRIEKNDALVLVLFALQENDGIGLTAYNEIFSVAVAHKLPILFALESPRDFADSTAFRETHFALPFIAVDARDIVAVYRVAQESIVRTREGSGPALIELTSFGDEDPVDKAHRYLHAKGLPASRWRTQAVRKFEKELQAACQAEHDPLA